MSFGLSEITTHLYLCNNARLLEKPEVATTCYRVGEQTRQLMAWCSLVHQTRCKVLLLCLYTSFHAPLPHTHIQFKEHLHTHTSTHTQIAHILNCTWTRVHTLLYITKWKWGTGWGGGKREESEEWVRGWEKVRERRWGGCGTNQKTHNWEDKITNQISRILSPTHLPEYEVHCQWPEVGFTLVSKEARCVQYIVWGGGRGEMRGKW